MLAGCWLGADWELAGSWLEAALSPMNPEYRAFFDLSRRLGVGGGILGLACGPYSGQPRKSREVLPIHRMLERSGGILQLVL